MYVLLLLTVWFHGVCLSLFSFSFSSPPRFLSLLGEVCVAHRIVGIYKWVVCVVLLSCVRVFDTESVMATAGVTGSVSVSLHPLVILNISEHWTRIRAQECRPMQGDVPELSVFFVVVVVCNSVKLFTFQIYLLRLITK